MRRCESSLYWGRKGADKKYAMEREVKKVICPFCLKNGGEVFRPCDRHRGEVLRCCPHCGEPLEFCSLCVAEERVDTSLEWVF
ncbi:MAG: hypothetical protein D6713_07895 [Deltaproteobacteria bacterium]|nr:MAG: hypothetical protein D6713_07895 [Deltaproteobacteria bacterium]